MDQPATAALTMTGKDERAAVHARAGWCMFAIAAVVLLIASLRNITAPWEHGMRGRAPAAYTDGAVAHTLAYGLRATLGMPTFVVEHDDGIERRVNWHHPPLYWLYMAGSAWLFGHHTWVLRVAHLLLFLPGLLGLFLLTRRRLGPLVAGVTALLFAACPLVAYFGPMVLQDGAVLGLGLLTISSFQRHLDAPGRRSWLRTAALFFVVTSIDFPGYWWGLAMFTLALGTTPRWRSIAWVLSLFPVSLLAFTTMAVHYGILLGGPLGFVREVLHVAGADHSDARAKVTWQHVERAMQDLFVEHGNWPLLALALLGLGLALAVRRAEVLRLAWLGIALCVPGVLNYGSMLVHALDHVFWSMHGFAGLCALAAIGPVVGMRWWAQGARGWRIAGAALVTIAGAVVAWGVYCTHAVISRNEFVDNGTPAILQKAMPHFDGCAWAMTSAPGVPQQFFGHTQTWADIETPDKLQIALHLGRSSGLRGKLAFVLHPKHRGTPLQALLDSMATALVVDDVLVYRLSL